ncbi:hypothetical protein BN2537_10419 [Streptomyces venezuelae]|nr:hypothetical protein BN2537_10419 [Streptomyces venezuelae]
MRPFTRSWRTSATLRRPRDPCHGVAKEPGCGGERCSPLVNWPGEPSLTPNHQMRSRDGNNERSGLRTCERAPRHPSEGLKTLLGRPQGPFPCEELHEPFPTGCRRRAR